uniref:Kelch domain-containing protein 3 n=1 Tax=Ciona savignyi TaxID=51511 RepID=H2ZPI0_CIOSA
MNSKMLPHWTVSLEGGPRRVNHAAVIVDHRIFMFGGYCMGEDYKQQRPIDVHVFNTYSYRWKKIISKQADELTEIPYMRYGHAAVTIGEIAYLWGGRNDSDGACNKLFSFNTCTGKWSKEKVNGSYPGARDGHAMCVVKGNIYMFGGYEEVAEQFSNEMYKLDMNGMIWLLIHHLEGHPANWRDFHTLTSCGDLIYVFGGREDLNGPIHRRQEVYDNALKVFCTRTKTWFEPVHVDSKRPVGRKSHSAFVYKGCLYIFGGYNSVYNQHFNDLWKYDPETRRWSEIRTIGNRPNPRRRQCVCLFEDRLFIFGGTSPASECGGQLLGTDELHDHHDTHTLDFSPSLKTLCIMVIVKHKLNQLSLPAPLRWEIKMAVTPNNITRL